VTHFRMGPVVTFMGETGDESIEGTMRVENVTEQYEFHCRPCNYKWQMTYRVWADADEESQTRHYCYLNGIPATPPAAGRLCPNCWAPAYSPRLVDEPILVPSRR
jgi:hypothetical protein